MVSLPTPRANTFVFTLHQCITSADAVKPAPSGLPAVVADGRTGFLIEEGDVVAMTARMLRLARDGRLAATLGQAARTRIETHFSMDRSIDRLASILEAATAGDIAGPGSTPPQVA